MRTPILRTLVTVCALSAVLGASQHVSPAAPATAFASEIARLSEPAGTFDTDNLISNESGYLNVIPALVSKRISGGTYLGVGPDQNFSYIARVQPTLAYIVDIRRDNLLLHLLFKALFARSATRMEYLSLLVGREPPADLDRWRNSTIAQIASFVDARAPVQARVDELLRQLRAAVTAFGVPLSAADLETIERFHRTFISAGLNLQFQSFGRPPRRYYPTFRNLLLATDGNGETWNYLAREEDFQFLKALQMRNAIVPVIGNVAGTRSMRAIADAVAAKGGHVSVFYVSNVETYLNGDGEMARFVENVRRLPHDGRSVMIRSIFGRDGESSSVVVPFFAQPDVPRRPPVH